MDILDSNSEENRQLVILGKSDQFILADLCRLCGNSNENLMSIDEGEGLQNELSRKIEKHLLVKVSENDCLPQQVCYHCARTVLTWHDLTENFLKVEEKFCEILRNMGHAKGVEFKTGSEVTQLATHEYSGNQKSVSYSKSTVEEKLLPTSGEFARSMQTSQNNHKHELHHCEWSDCKERGNCVMDRSSEYHDLFLYRSCEEKKNMLHELCFDKKVESTTHLACDHLDCIYHCDKCDKLFKEKTELIVHMKSHDDMKENVDKWDQPCQTEEHQTSDDTVPPEDHSYCSAESLQKHQKKSIKSDFICSVCESSFSRKLDLKRHCQNHLESADSQDTSRQVVSCTDHIPDVPGMKLQKIFHCEKCGRNFTTKDSYIRHYRIHTGEKPFTCDMCGKQFRDGGGLRRHLRDVHDRIKSFGCDFCGRFFASKATRDDHRRIHTGERPYICHCCGKTFKSKASLYIHSKIHTDSFPHRCAYCEKGFRRRQELINHTTTHTGEKPHVCEVCGKSFGVRGEMLRHKVTHSDDRPFVCSGCGLGFKQKRYLRKHEKTHRKDT